MRDNRIPNIDDAIKFINDTMVCGQCTISVKIKHNEKGIIPFSYVYTVMLCKVNDAGTHTRYWLKAPHRDGSYNYYLLYVNSNGVPDKKTIKYVRSILRKHEAGINY